MAEDKGLRYNAGKTRYDLIPAFAQEQYARVITKGSEKYSDRNWEFGMRWSKVLASMKRHIAAFERGEDFDPETGCYHMSHAMCNAAFLTEYYKIYPQGDDRPHKYLTAPKIGLDIDEVLCDFVSGWHKEFGADPKPEWWTYHRNMGGCFDVLRNDNRIDDFYLSLTPKVSPKDIPFEPHCYVTSRPVVSATTEKWLAMHGFPAVKVYTVGIGESKVDVIKNSGIDIFVDDRFENFVELNKAGICCYLYDAPHNQRYDVGFKRIKSLKELA